jgi:hypothetical protein
MRNPPKSSRGGVAACALTLVVLSGCSSSNFSIPWPFSRLEDPSAASANGGSVPDIQNCIVISTGIDSGSPPQYVCNGKTYTSRELRNLRETGGKSSN